MATTAPPQSRIASLDIIRGIAVMGIFSVNIVGMAMIESAYFDPPRFGFEGFGDKLMWALNFIFVDGRFRSLFSILFGASMVLVIERAVAAGKAGWRVHYPRMVVLLLFGLAHFYFLWWGDILANYAMVGMIAYVFWKMRARTQLIIACCLLALMYVPMTAFLVAYEFDVLPAEMTPDVPERGSEEQIESIERDVAMEGAATADLAAHFYYTITETPWRPFMSVVAFGAETLGLMLLGMAAYRSGFLTGAWERETYRKIAFRVLMPMLAYYSVAAIIVLRSDFAFDTMMPLVQLLPNWFHPIGALGYAALAILIIKPGALADRLAAVGRAAFTNYLGCTVIGVFLFYDFAFGLWGEVSRGEAWLFVPPVWAFMLVWSKWWLDRFRYGPLEWAWRSMSRASLQPMRKPVAA